MKNFEYMLHVNIENWYLEQIDGTTLEEKSDFKYGLLISRQSNALLLFQQTEFTIKKWMNILSRFLIKIDFSPSYLIKTCAFSSDKFQVSLFLGSFSFERVFCIPPRFFRFFRFSTFSTSLRIPTKWP